jgi:hypothetical protein
MNTGKWVQKQAICDALQECTCASCCQEHFIVRLHTCSVCCTLSSLQVLRKREEIARYVMCRVSAGQDALEQTIRSRGHPIQSQSKEFRHKQAQIVNRPATGIPQSRLIES